MRLSPLYSSSLSITVGATCRRDAHGGWLKRVLHGNLHLAWVAGQAPTLVEHRERIDDGEITGWILVPVITGFVVVNRVGEVLDLQAHFQFLALGDASPLGYRQTEILIPSKPEVVPSDIAKFAC